ncbi:MAG TPA: YCF48-related protein [Acetobacteraceae bacterium]|nr:YCF48-related protein [Acetobacteraceae bacterium]
MNDEVPRPETDRKAHAARRRQPQRDLTDTERQASSDAIDAISQAIRARARRLRRLGHLILTTIIILLVGGLGVVFYSQILLIANSTEQSNAIKKQQDLIDQEKQNLDQLAAEFARLRQDVVARAAVTTLPTILAFNTLRSVQFAADGRRGWAVGCNGTILATQNGGESWQSQTSGTTNKLRSVQFAADGRRGWAVGRTGSSCGWTHLT